MIAPGADAGERFDYTNERQRHEKLVGRNGDGEKLRGARRMALP